MYQYKVKVEGRIQEEIVVQSSVALSDEEISEQAIEEFKDEYAGAGFNEVEVFESELISYPTGGTTPLASDAGDSAVSTSSLQASADTTSQAESAPTQRG